MRLPMKPAAAPNSVPISVASTAASTPTKTEISVPLIALDNTSRPRRSPPKGSVSTRWISCVFICAARSAHSLYRGASGSMSLKSTLGPFGTSIVPRSSGGRGPSTVGGAFGTPTSACQWRATTPVAERTISSRNAATISSDTMPTRSLRKRRHAVRHTPSECATCAGAIGSTAVMSPPWPCGPSPRGGASAFGAAGRRSFQNHPGIDQLVEKIGGQVDQHRQHRQIHRGRLDDRIVAAIDRQIDLAPEARDREEDLDQERADEDARQRVADVGEDRDHRVAQHVPEQHHVLSHALGARC